MSEKTYRSLFGAPSLITISQYIAELVISRQAKFLKVSLPNLFWKQPAYIEWTRRLKIQKMRVEALKKCGYDDIIILGALNSKQGQYIATLFNKKLDFLLEEEKRKKDNKQVIEQPKIEISKVDEAPKVFIPNKPSKLDKLRD